MSRKTLSGIRAVRLPAGTRNAQQAVVEVEEVLFRNHPDVVDADRLYRNRRVDFGFFPQELDL